jgi:proteasome component ECM29
VKQFKEQTTPLIRNLDLMYIQQGIDRLPASEKKELLPVVIAGIRNSGTHGPQIFELLLRLLEFFPLPLRGSKEDADLRTQMQVFDEDVFYLAAWLGNFILYIPQKANDTTCPGLKPEDYAFLNQMGKDSAGNARPSEMNLLRTKILAAKLLASGVFSDKERFLPALFASADPASTISDVGDDMMKRALPATDLEDEALLRRLFSLFFGDNGAASARAPLKLKILGLLGKSTKSTSFANAIMRLVDDGISPPATDGEDVVMSNTLSR